MQRLWDLFQECHTGPASVHSKGLNIASAEGEFFGFYSFDVDALRKGNYQYSGENQASKRFVGGVLSPLLYEGMDWHAHEVIAVGEDENSGSCDDWQLQLDPCKIDPDPFYVWKCGGDQGVDLSTGKHYDVRDRPWYRHAVEIGEGFTAPYPDPVTGEGMVSYVIPIRDECKDGDVLGVVIAGSFLDETGNFGAEC
jgi:hypothetical protein